MVVFYVGGLWFGIGYIYVVALVAQDTNCTYD